MKKLSDFTIWERIITVISVIWLIIIFAYAFDDSHGSFDEDFVNTFLVGGLIPVFLVVGLKWIFGTKSK